MSNLEASVAILMPVISQANYDRFTTRYSGLDQELGALAVPHFFADTHASYDAETHSFTSMYDIHRQDITPPGEASVVRDLTMALDAKPLYEDSERPQLVHDPETNRFIANKANIWRALPDAHPLTVLTSAADIAESLDLIPGERVIAKPTTGMASKGVQILSKQEAARATYDAGEYLLQEFIDTRGGIPSLNIEGVHNLRAISIDSLVIGAIARVNGRHEHILQDDVYGAFVEADDIPESMQAITDAVHEVLRGKPGAGQNVIAIDFMRGRNAEGEQVDVLCEVNRRPMRISAYNLLNDQNLDPTAISRMAKLWDKAEAGLLARQLR